MKIYCSCCDKVQPVRIDNCRDAKTNEPFQDIVCAECDLVIASGTDIAQQQDHDCALKRGGIVCRHCDLEIVEVSHDPQIARQQDIPDLIAGALGVSRGTAYDMMREALVGAQQQESVACAAPMACSGADKCVFRAQQQPPTASQENRNEQAN